MSVAKYGPKLLQFWRRAVIEPQVLEIAERNQAISLRHRLYKLRLDMKKELPDDWKAAQKVTLRIEPFKRGNETIYKLIASHSDEQFNDLLAQFDVPSAPILPDLE